jgi:Integrase core domain
LVDSFKTELIVEQVRRTRSQVELAVVEYIARYNNDRLHPGLPQPVEHKRTGPPPSSRGPNRYRPLTAAGRRAARAGLFAVQLKIHRSNRMISYGKPPNPSLRRTQGSSFSTRPIRRRNRMMDAERCIGTIPGRASKAW